MTKIRTAVLAAGLLWAFASQADVILEVPAGSTDVSVELVIIDDTTGAFETGVVFNTATLDIEYCRDFAACVDVGLNALTTPALTDAHEDGAFLHKGFGKYRLDLPDAAVAAGVKQVTVQGGGVTGMLVLGGSVVLNNLPTAAPGAAAGLPINGTNAGNRTFSGTTTYTGHVAYSDGVALTASTSNRTAFVATGNGTGNGATFTSGSGATGSGLAATAASTNGSGLFGTGTGTGHGLVGVAGSTGNGIRGLGGVTSGAGINAIGNAGNAVGLEVTGTGNGAGASFTGAGTGSGILATSGGGATGNGAQFTSAATNGSGIGLTATGSGTGINGTLATVTNLTNAPTAGDFTATMKTSGETFTGTALATYDGPTNAEMEARTLVAANYFDPGADGVFLSTSVNNCRAATGCEAQGTLSGTHSFTTADLGTNAPAATTEVVGKTLVVAGKASRVVTAYNSGTGVATFAPATALTLANADQWYLWGTPPSPNASATALDARLLTCTVDTATFAGSAQTLACDLTDRDGAVVTSGNNRLTGLQLKVMSGAQDQEERWINATAWDAANNELQITLDRALPGTLADAVTAIIQ